MEKLQWWFTTKEGWLTILGLLISAIVLYFIGWQIFIAFLVLLSLIMFCFFGGGTGFVIWIAMWVIIWWV